MGVRSVMKQDPLKIVRDLWNSAEDKLRRKGAQRRLDLYRDRTEGVLKEQFLRFFTAQAAARRQRLEAFASLGSALSIFKRIVNELAGPIYNPPPLRMVSASGQDAWNTYAQQARVDRRMDLAAHLVVASNTVLVHDRASVNLGRVVRDVLTPNMYTVIWHPDDNSVELGVVYRKLVMVGGQLVEHLVYWDDEMAFELDQNGEVKQLLTVGNGHPGILPFVSIHMRERSCEYWDSTTGNDLEAAQQAVSYLVASAMRLHHTQGHQQIGVNGDKANFPKGQVIDSENPIFSGPENALVALWNPTDPGHLLKTLDSVITNVAANYGLSRARINSEVDTAGDSPLLLERRHELLETMYDAELRCFEMAKAVSQSAGLKPIAKDAQIEVVYPEITAKVDRKAQLEIRKLERSMGLRSVVTDVLEDSPEFGADRDRAWQEINRHLEEEAEYIKLRRSFGFSGEATVEEPGQPQEQNGAMGPKVRDGEMSKDEAASQAVAGKVPAPEAKST